MKMKEVINQYHIGRKALLLYEDKGLINPIRNKSGYREYSDEDIENLKKIIMLRKLDITLEEISDILHHNKQWVETKEKEYIKQIETLETKRKYLKNVSNAIQNFEDMEKTYSRVEEVFDNEKDNKNIIIFNAFFAFLFLWYIAFAIALYSHDPWFIGLSIIAGLQFILIYMKRIQPPYIPKSIIRIIPWLLILIGIVSVFISMNVDRRENIFIMSSFVWSVLIFVSGICLNDRLVERLLEWDHLFDLFFVGILIIGLSIVWRIYFSSLLAYILLYIGSVLLFLYTILKKYV